MRQFEFEDTACLLCGRAERMPHCQATDWQAKNPSTFEYVRCTHCGFVYLSPRPTRESIGLAYADQDLHPASQQSLATSPLHQRELHHGLMRRLQFIRAWSRSGRVLDIGCGAAQLAAAMASTECWQVTAVDASPAALRAARSRSSTNLILTDANAPLPFADGSFDLIMLWDVLEHLHDPAWALQEARRLCRSPGHLIVTVPDVESPQARLLGSHWVGYDPPRHLAVFGAGTLSVLMKRAGWNPLAVSRFTGARAMLTMSLMAWLRRKNGPGRRRLAHFLESTTLGQSALGLPFAVLARAGLSSHVTIVAGSTE